MDGPMLAETVSLVGGGDDIEAYFARPLGPGPYPSVVVIHHMPGFDRSTKEIVRTFSVDRPNYRVDATREGWKLIWAFFGQHLAIEGS